MRRKIQDYIILELDSGEDIFSDLMAYCVKWADVSLVQHHSTVLGQLWIIQTFSEHASISDVFKLGLFIKAIIESNLVSNLPTAGRDERGSAFEMRKWEPTVSPPTGVSSIEATRWAADIAAILRGYERVGVWNSCHKSFAGLVLTCARMIGEKCLMSKGGKRVVLPQPVSPTTTTQPGEFATCCARAAHVESVTRVEASFAIVCFGR